VIIQVALGLFIHHIHFNFAPFNKTESRKSLQNYLHITLGIAITVLGYYNVRKGMKEWEDNDVHTPKGVIVVFWIVLGFEVRD
jgi:hypothetical protein